MPGSSSLSLFPVWENGYKNLMEEQAPVLIELQYLPPLAYFVLLSEAEALIIDAHEHYVKQTYRNRCYIKGPHQVEKLTVPVQGGNKKIKTSEIRIDYGQKWVQQHWRALQSAYGKAPFFEHYAPFFREIFEREPALLWELNMELLTLCLKLLQIDKTITFTDSYLKDTNPLILDCRSSINPKKSPVVSNIYRPVSYNQIFGKDFVSNLSVVDLLFCEGPAAGLILQESANISLNN